MNKLIKYDVKFPVKVRKYEVDIQKLKLVLRESRKKSRLSIKKISEMVDRPKTEVEHWFRTDDCFSIPSPDIWFDLKEIIHIETDEFDKSIITFVEREGVYDQANRVYDIKGIAPTLTVSGEVKILLNDKKSNIPKYRKEKTPLKTNLDELKVLELFAGIGAWSKALENLQIPHKVIEAIEFDEKTMNAYNVIHNSRFTPKDIKNLNEKDMSDFDMVCYSPPCQAFSQSGKKLGFDDQRGILFFDALRIIKEKKPKFALMENVKGLTQKKFTNEFNTMLKELELAGYKNYWKIINAKNYIPQNRERIFIISIRNDIKIDYHFPIKKESTLTLEHLLEDESDLKYNTYDGLKVRSLTPFETFRLMGFDDEDYNKVQQLCYSPKQYYKFSGNSIVVDVCEDIFKSLFTNNK